MSFYSRPRTSSRATKRPCEFARKDSDDRNLDT